MVDRAGAAALASAMAPGDDERRDRIAVDVAALGLLHELGHRAIGIERRRESTDGGPMARALSSASARLGADVVGSALAAFEGAFPPTPVYRGELDVDAWLARSDTDVPGREAALEELALTWVALQNPAAMPYRELFDDAPLAARPIRGSSGPSVALTSPSTTATSTARLPHVRSSSVCSSRPAPHPSRWLRSCAGSGPTGPGGSTRPTSRASRPSCDELDAVERETFLHHRRAAPGTGTAQATSRAWACSGRPDEPEAFSEDRDWMAELVLVAKSTYVWLAQLSRQYGRGIWRLDQVPDEELDELRSRGFTGLWLIGIWERSQASRSIKQRRGNPDAMASAYSVADYRIADELGGDAAWRDLRDRAAARGLRLAADMVPNHMGIDSSWVIEHPDRFISSPYPPFEAYRYDGPDLSADDRVILQIEDHYWDSSDAAVTFRRTDRATGDTRYIYHGNDGTSFPWNDTAQLDFLRADVREAVIGQILEVARRFPVIRFDAAMVLAKRHIERLWYPLPGQEAGIPSRGAAALPAAEFERRMPAEFWREVVDRVAAEAPDTLLLAEAFWLLEGYFVRTLGMHRVYNSAFMHMLRDERNAEYQNVIRETKGMFTSQAQFADGPASAVTHMNRALCRRGLESRFVTLMFGIMQANGTLTYCNAGHNPPFVLGKSGKVRRLEEGGPVVGLLEFAPYSQETVQLTAGDTVVIFSDGVSEALNAAGEEFGDDRLERVSASALDQGSSVLVERIVASVREFTKGAPQSDDITVMVIRYLGAGV